jgi:hypothetical protein
MYKAIMLTESRTVVSFPLIASRSRITMKQPIIRIRSKTPACNLCGEQLETAITAQNPRPVIRENSLARCPSCLILVWIGADLQSSPGQLGDEAWFDAAIRASPEFKEWALGTPETVRLRAATEIKADCAAAREWLIERNSADLLDDLATLDTWAASFDEKGFTSASSAVRTIGSGILVQMRSQAAR